MPIPVLSPVYASSYVPGPTNDVADMWACHFNLIYDRVNFFLKFHLYLAYDIRLRRRYVYNTSFNPASWQSAVWDQIVKDARTKHLSPLPLSAPAASGSSAFFSFCSSTKGTGDLSFHPSPSTRPSLAPASCPRFRCIFCGVPSCINHACGTTTIGFMSLSNSTWQTAQGEQICFHFNRQGCSEPSCPCKHLCSRCGSMHSVQECNL